MALRAHRKFQANGKKRRQMSEPTQSPPAKASAVRPKDAATLVLIRRDDRGAPLVLMGQRATGHVFMPNKWVFPGGRVDRADAFAPAAHELTPETEARLAEGGVRRKSRAFALAAVRETFEETGLLIGKLGHKHWPAPAGWGDYCKHHAAADLSKFSFICRAITPPSRPRRFDARFFLAFADQVLLDDRIHVEGDELLHIEWFTLEAALGLDLPPITRFIIGDVAKRLAGEPQPLQFFHHGSPFPFERGP